MKTPLPSSPSHLVVVVVRVAGLVAVVVESKYQKEL